MYALLFVVTFLFFWSAGGEFLVFGAPKNKVNCIASNQPVMLVHKNEDGTAKEEEVDDWRVICTLTLGDKQIFNDILVLAHPTKFREAMDAIDEFRTKTAAKLIKENSK